MEKLKIVGWTYFEDSYPTKTCDNDEILELIDLVSQEIYDNDYVFSGEEHQNSLTGVPVFSDGTCLRASMRAWGTIMAGIYKTPDGEDLSYMDFYMSLGDIANLPKESALDIEPANVESSTGLIVEEDRNLIDEAIKMNMSFMTTDKVLEEIFRIINKNKN